MNESSLIKVVADGSSVVEVVAGGEPGEGSVISSAKTAVGLRGRSVAERAKMRLKAQNAMDLKFFIFLS